jgi:hypothetical protein
VVNDQIVSCPGFLSAEEINYLISVCKTVPLWDERNNPYWDGRVVSMFTASRRIQCGESISMLGSEIVLRLSKLIQEKFEVEKQVFVDCLDLVRWPVGSEMTPHVDEVPHAHRLWGSVIYLNDDYDGGETYYPNLGVSVKPRSGMAVVHRGDSHHLHGVSKVENGERFTIATFWGVDRSKSLLFG